MKIKARLFFTIFFAVVFLLWAVTMGLNKGKSQAQAKLVSGNGQVLAQALGRFYQDQNRYPTAAEFSDKNIMLNYLNDFPPQEFPSPVCAGSFVYKRISFQNFQLNFCLPQAVGNFNQGWNQLTAN